MSIKAAVISHNSLDFTPYISKDRIHAEMKRVANEISNEYRDKFPLFIAILNGAFVFCSDLVRNIDFIECQTEFCKVSSYDGLSSSGQVRQLIGLKNSIKGRHVIIVEDIVETGVTMNQLLQSLVLQEPASIKVATMFVKQKCLKVAVQLDYVGLNLEEDFVVGYGLDYDEWGRNLPDVWRMQSKSIQHNPESEAHPIDLQSTVNDPKTN